ncbi:unnamed protein product [Chrysoparadoxa australica]
MTWVHDHLLGLTRMNVYAGLAHHWIIRDEHERKAFKKIRGNCALVSTGCGGCELEIVLQVC